MSCATSCVSSSIARRAAFSTMAGRAASLRDKVSMPCTFTFALPATSVRLAVGLVDAGREASLVADLQPLRPCPLAHLLTGRAQCRLGVLVVDVVRHRQG